MDEILDRHDAIAWDMDETLINGPNSKHLCAYIARTGLTRQFHIVTFRDPMWARIIPLQLGRKGVPKECIKGIHTCPQDLWHANYLLETALQTTCPETRDLLLGKADLAKLEADSLLYVEWKGYKAKELGCTLLVDDNHGHVLPGCTKHGVAFLHSFGADYAYTL